MPKKKEHKWPGRHTPGYIYFLRPANFDSGIKIGFSQYPEFRAKTLKSETGIPLKLMGTIPGTKTHERKLHAILHHYRIHGEWFYTRHKKWVRDFVWKLIDGELSLDEVLDNAEDWNFRLGGNQRYCECGRLK